MILYRENTQIRLCINITDTGKHEHFGIHYCFSYHRGTDQIKERSAA